MRRELSYVSPCAVDGRLFSSVLHATLAMTFLHAHGTHGNLCEPTLGRNQLKRRKEHKESLGPTLASARRCTKVAQKCHDTDESVRNAADRGGYYSVCIPD